ncbi:AraC family transcriptional regulator [Actinophytocola sp.]|uniref:AraC family transcriptional regulator n=1 Tax=Actinophytocola sp. TaxID=1872138 RepID=UPI002D7EA041|nr:GyrI-like domain-containing protein [Actinophytocola sp.]HET9140582.1 GyrI-like domain-containing protein [Actinophytocola sp.]HEU5110760.1 GyrI-like domain-containing protein [Micromonosporaceae bacterium]
MAADLPNLARFDYVDRINLAIDHAVRNLAEPLRLADLASAAAFSPYHFHRIFSALMGETVLTFVKRVRLERALFLMSHRRDLSFTQVAQACGFTSSSDFSRSFRARYGVSPRGLDIDRFRSQRRADLLQTLEPQERHRLRSPAPGGDPAEFTVRLRRVPGRRVAYIRVFRPYDGGVPAAAERLVAWAQARGLADGQWLGYQWEDPETVPPELCRYDVGLEVPPDRTGDGEVSMTTFPAMTLAEVDVAGTIDDELRVLRWLYQTWLPASGFVPAHQPCFEAWHGRPFAGDGGEIRLRVQLPVVAPGARFHT